MKQIALTFALLSGMAVARPGPADLIANIPRRTTVSLDGTWNAIVDPYETGLRAKFYENAKAKDETDLVEYNFDTAGTLKVPGDWNTQRESLMFYENPVWYQRYFSYYKRAKTRVFVYVGAAHYQSRIWLNGKKLGEHTGGFTAFNFEATDALATTVTTAWWSRLTMRGARMASRGWTATGGNYGGLTRSVELVEVPETFVQDYFVQLAKGSLNEIAGWVRLKAPQAVAIQIPEIGWKKSLTPDNHGYAEFRASAQLKLWTPENPKLYPVVISMGVRQKSKTRLAFADRSQWDANPSGRQADFSARHLDARGSSIPRWAGLLRGGRQHASGLGQGVGLQFHPADALSAQRDIYPAGRSKRGSALVGGSGLLAHFWDNPGDGGERRSRQLRDMVDRDRTAQQ